MNFLRDKYIYFLSYLYLYPPIYFCMLTHMYPHVLMPDIPVADWIFRLVPHSIHCCAFATSCDLSTLV